MPVLAISEDEIVSLLSQLPVEARERIYLRLESGYSVEESEAHEATVKEAAAQEDFTAFLDSLPVGPRSAGSWEEVERSLQDQRDAWER